MALATRPISRAVKVRAFLVVLRVKPAARAEAVIARTTSVATAFVSSAVVRERLVVTAMLVAAGAVVSPTNVSRMETAAATQTACAPEECVRTAEPRVSPVVEAGFVKRPGSHALVPIVVLAVRAADLASRAAMGRAAMVRAVAIQTTTAASRMALPAVVEACAPEGCAPICHQHVATGKLACMT